MTMPTVPTPIDRPTEWAVSVIAAVLALVSVFVTLPEGFDTAFLALIAVLAPGVTAVVAHRRRSRDGRP